MSAKYSKKRLRLLYNILFNTEQKNCEIHKTDAEIIIYYNIKPQKLTYLYFGVIYIHVKIIVKTIKLII